MQNTFPYIKIIRFFLLFIYFFKEQKSFGAPQVVSKSNSYSKSEVK